MTDRAHDPAHHPAPEGDGTTGADGRPDPARSDPARERDARRRERRAAEERMKQQGTWVDLQIRQAMDRGDFDKLPGYGKPLRISDRHDPDWWVKGLVERENITGVLPPALQLRKDDAALDDRLDGLNTEAQVREAVAEFNASVRRALYSTWGDPPVVTSPRDPDVEVERWAGRRRARLAELAARRTAPSPAADADADADRRNRSKERSKPRDKRLRRRLNVLLNGSRNRGEGAGRTASDEGGGPEA